MLYTTNKFPHSTKSHPPPNPTIYTYFTYKKIILKKETQFLLLKKGIR